MKQILICDYCQSPGAIVINDEGFIFHKECAKRFAKNQEITRGMGCQPLTTFIKIRRNEDE